MNEPSGICSLYDDEEKDIKVFIADCNNHCIRYVHYDQGVLTTPQIKGIPAIVAFEEAKYQGEEDQRAEYENEDAHHSATGELPAGEKKKRTSVADTTAQTTDTNDTMDNNIACDGDVCYFKFGPTMRARQNRR